jgi:hypothetical protein
MGGLRSNRPVTTLLNGARVRKDMAGGWGLALPMLLPEG